MIGPRGSSRGSSRGALSQLVEGLVNRTLSLDPESERILAGLDGARVRVVVEGIRPASVLLELDGARVRVSEDADGQADAEVRGLPQRLLAMLLAGDGLPSVYGVQVSGDVAMLATLTRAAREIAPDWEEPIARGLGDAVAAPVIAGLRGLATFAHDAALELTDITAEYLREESELLVRFEDVNELAALVQRIDEDAARLEKRMSIIERRLDALT